MTDKPGLRPCRPCSEEYASAALEELDALEEERARWEEKSIPIVPRNLKDELNEEALPEFRCLMRHAMVDMGMSLRALAKQCACTHPALRDAFIGKRRVSLYMLQGLKRLPGAKMVHNRFTHEQARKEALGAVA